MVGVKINSKLRNTLIAAAVIALIFVIPTFFPEKDFRAKYENYDLSATTGASSSLKTYEEYLKQHSSAKTPSVEVPVDILNYIEEKSSGVPIVRASTALRLSLFRATNASERFLFALIIQSPFCTFEILCREFIA